MKKLARIAYGILSVFAIIALSSCNREPSIIGYWERVSGGDSEPGVCMILNFTETNVLEKIVLYGDNDKYVHGYTENCGPYIYNDKTNTLVAWGENYTISLSSKELRMEDMVFKKLDKKDVEKMCSGVPMEQE